MSRERPTHQKRPQPKHVLVLAGEDRGTLLRALFTGKREQRTAVHRTARSVSPSRPRFIPSKNKDRTSLCIT